MPKSRNSSTNKSASLKTSIFRDNIRERSTDAQNLIDYMSHMKLNHNTPSIKDSSVYGGEGFPDTMLLS